MAASRGPHVKDIFVQKKTTLNNFASSTYTSDGFHFEKKADQTKSKLKSSKKTPAPPRPTFNNYKPKILQVDSIVNVPIVHNKPSPAVPKDFQNSVGVKPLIIGDKDTPIVIEPIDDEEYTEIHDDTLSGMTTPSIHDEERTTTNPLFDNSEKSSLGHVGESHRHHSGNMNASHSVLHKTISEEINGVSVPEPDYEDDEVTMDFEGEADVDLDDGNISKNRPNSVYKAFEGEDLSNYLNDEQDEIVLNMRKQTTYSRLGNKTEGKLYKKRDSSHIMFGGTTKQGKQGKPKAGSVRHYSVENTKLGLGVDGKARNNSVRNGIDIGTTYESFLNSRHGTMTEIGGNSEIYGLEFEESSKFKNHKTTLWKKLTLRLKRKAVLIH